MQSHDRRALRRAVACGAWVLFVLLACAWRVEAQSVPTEEPSTLTVRIIRATPVMQTPRGDSLVMGLLAVGTVLDVRERQGAWLRVLAPVDAGVDWTMGWVHTQDIEVVGGSLPLGRPSETARPAPGPPGRLSVRGFVQGGGALFAAGDSFDTLVGTRFLQTYGVGGQVTFPSGAYFQVAVSRSEKRGSRVAVTPGQIFRLEVPHTVTLTPVEATLGYRMTHTARLASFLGVGLGWHILEESTPALAGDTSTGHLGYHLVAGAEYAIGPWVAVAGEAQWGVVPGALGDDGVSAVFEEEDLGGGVFRVKILVGR